MLEAATTEDVVYYLGGLGFHGRPRGIERFGLKQVISQGIARVAIHGEVNYEEEPFADTIDKVLIQTGQLLGEIKARQELMDEEAPKRSGRLKLVGFSMGAATLFVARHRLLKIVPPEALTLHLIAPRLSPEEVEWKNYENYSTEQGFAGLIEAASEAKGIIAYMKKNPDTATADTRNVHLILAQTDERISEVEIPGVDPTYLECASSHMEANRKACAQLADLLAA